VGYPGSLLEEYCGKNCPNFRVVASIGSVGLWVGGFKATLNVEHRTHSHINASTHQLKNRAAKNYRIFPETGRVLFD